MNHHCLLVPSCESKPSLHHNAKTILPTPPFPPYDLHPTTPLSLDTWLYLCLPHCPNFPVEHNSTAHHLNPTLWYAQHLLCPTIGTRNTTSGGPSHHSPSTRPLHQPRTPRFAIHLSPKYPCKTHRRNIRVHHTFGRVRIHLSDDQPRPMVSYHCSRNAI